MDQNRKSRSPFLLLYELIFVVAFIRKFLERSRSCIQSSGNVSCYFAALNCPGINILSPIISTPLKKVAMPSDIASQVVIHASRKVSGHVTGQVLMITGGMEGEC